MDVRVGSTSLALESVKAIVRSAQSRSPTNVRFRLPAAATAYAAAGSHRATSDSDLPRPSSAQATRKGEPGLIARVSICLSSA